MPPEIRVYEALFLFNPAVINSSVVKATEIVQELLNRASAETVSISKWDDRKLAYEIRGVKRGLYMLAHFRSGGAAIAHIENDVNLSEQVMRVLITRADHAGELEIKQALERQTETRTLAALEGQTPVPAPAAAAPAAAEPAAQE